LFSLIHILKLNFTKIFHAPHLHLQRSKSLSSKMANYGENDCYVIKSPAGELTKVFESKVGCLFVSDTLYKLL
jgi:hypothetical protein